MPNATRGAPGGAIRNSVVRFELEPDGERVRLTLTHRALPVDSYTTIGAGWHAHLDTLVAVASGIEGPDANARYEVIGPRYAPLATYPSAGTVRLERILLAPIDTVWAFLTQAELLATWLARGTILSQVGDHFTLTMLPNDDEIAATIQAYEPPQLLAYTWFSAKHETPRDEHSAVRFELTPHEGGTTLVLTHGGVLPEFRGRTGAGWHTLLDALAVRVADGETPDFFSIFPRFIDGYESLASER